jgi:hypothetical protein
MAPSDLADPAAVLREAEVLAYGAGMLLRYAGGVPGAKGNQTALRAQVHTLAHQLQALADAIEPPLDPVAVAGDLLKACQDIGSAILDCTHPGCHTDWLRASYDRLADILADAEQVLEDADREAAETAARAVQ